jgi:RHS repeat-associated protein
VTTTYGGTAGPQISFNYDNGSRLTSASRQIGSSNTATEVNTTVVYDAANRVGTMTDGVSTYGLGGWSTTPLATQVYSYDNASRVTSQKDAEGTASFTYDNTNELTGVSGSRSESYSYDLNGNRNTSGWTTGTENEMTASPGYTFTYDNAGNMTGQTNTSTHVTVVYNYDFRNRLTGVTVGATATATFTYDVLDRRIGAKENGTQTWTVYDGQSPDAQPYADFNGSGSLTTRYVHGPGVINGAAVDELLARTSSGGTTAWYLPDKLGSVRDVVDTSGNVLDHLVYDSFGNVVTETNASNGDRFKFGLTQYDGTIGQYFDHARWYGSGPGRFFVLDPIGFAAADPNLFRYTRNNPINHTDPTGRDDAGRNGGTISFAAGVIVPEGTEILPENEKLGWQPFDATNIPPNVDAIVFPGPNGGLLKIPDYVDVTVLGYAEDGQPITDVLYRYFFTWWPTWYPPSVQNPFFKTIPPGRAKPPPPPPPWWMRIFPYIVGPQPILFPPGRLGW